MDEFYEGLADILELDLEEIKPELRLEDTTWDSLAVVSTIALIDEVFDEAVSADALNNCETIGDMEKLIASSRAASGKA
jgi:acyl carrier protein